MNRRDLLKNSIVGLSALASSKVLGSTAICSPGETPNQPEGPFYPIMPQVDTDSDLVTVAGKSKVALGQVIIVEGFVQDTECNPVENVLVEIWQAGASGKYNHRADPNPAPLDPNFQYWGKAVTNSLGFYRFRTIIPGAYRVDQTWIRPPHIHFKVSKLGYEELITQMYFEGESLNQQDKILQRISKKEQEQLIVSFTNNSELRHPTGEFNIQIKKIT